MKGICLNSCRHNSGLLFNQDWKKSIYKDHWRYQLLNILQYFPWNVSCPSTYQQLVLFLLQHCLSGKLVRTWFLYSGCDDLMRMFLHPLPYKCYWCLLHDKELSIAWTPQYLLSTLTRNRNHTTVIIEVVSIRLVIDTLLSFLILTSAMQQRTILCSSVWPKVMDKPQINEPLYMNLIILGDEP